jgi:signal transduction histidine kinase
MPLFFSGAVFALGCAVGAEDWLCSDELGFPSASKEVVCVTKCRGSASIYESGLRLIVRDSPGGASEPRITLAMAGNPSSEGSLPLALNRLRFLATCHSRTAALHVEGRVRGERPVTPIPAVIFLGFTLTRWSLTGVVLAVVVLAVGAGARYCLVRNSRRKVEELRQQQVLEQERIRIARDLHDDLGPAVTQIKLLGELVERDAGQPAQIARHGHQIWQTSRDLAKHMDELVWVVNPQKDHLENLVSYLAAYSEELLGETDIRCRLDFPEELPNLPMPGHLRHRLFLALKEALNNVLKHAQATEVCVRLRLTSGELLLSVEDNGRGFEMPVPRSNTRSGFGGNGLANLQARLSENGGTCLIESRPGTGTKVQMRAKLS